MVGVPPQFLVVDAGNSRVKFGLFNASREPAALPMPEWTSAIPCGENLPFGECPAPGVVSMIAGSNPAEVDRIRAAWPLDWPRPDLLADRSALGVEINVDEPERVGIDRLLNAVATNVLRDVEQPAVIISSGTATTVDYIDAEGRFCGGAILPGFDLCAAALHQYTALLPLVPLDALPNVDQPPAEIGKNTTAAITSGLYWGHVGAVKELMRRLMHADGVHAEPLLILTGGAAGLLQPHLPTFVRSEPHLAMQGLALTAIAAFERADR